MPYVIALFLALVFDFGANPSIGATLQQIRQRGYMIVVTQNDYPPFEYKASAGFVGYDNDLLAGLRKSAEFEIVQEIVPWQDVVPGVAAGKYDLALTAAAVTRARAKLVDFTTPVAAVTMAYIELNAAGSGGTLRDLSGKTLGVQKGGVSFEVLGDLREDLERAGGRLGKVVQYDTYAEAYEALVERRVDAVINNRDSLSQLVSSKSGLFRLGQTIGPRVYVAWAVRKGNGDLLTWLNAYLADQKTNGTLTRLRAKYQLTFDGVPDQLPLLGDPPM